MRPPSKADPAHLQASKKLPSNLRVRARRRSLIGRSKASVPFSSGSLGSHHQRPEDGGNDQVLVTLKDRDVAELQAGVPLQRNIQALQEYLMVLAPQRLHYEIQMASGWDAGYPPEELVGLMQTSVGKGWHTPRFCSYPQDLVLRFSSGYSRIRKIQILSHQYKIASKLDFWMGSRKGAVLSDIHENGGQENGQDANYGQDGGDNNYEAEDDSIDLIGYDIPKKELPVLQFQKLGSISFDSNAGSNYSGRELRSINFDVKGEYLRVVIRQCHVNPLNIYHQVAILALNVLGEPLNDELVADSERLDFDECEVINGPGQGFTEATSAIQSFIPEPEPILPDMPSLGDAVRSLSIAETKVHQDSYLDQEVQRLVSGFIKAKLDAVKVEDFHSAKLYKAGYEQVIQWADEIQALDIEKRQAAETEDFDLAQDLKAQVNDIKAKMDAHLSQNGFYIVEEENATRISMTPPRDQEDASERNQSSFVLTKSASVGNFSNVSAQLNTTNSSFEGSHRRLQTSRKSLPPTPSIHRPPSTTSENSSDPERPRRNEYSGKIPLPFSRSHSSGLIRHPHGSPKIPQAHFTSPVLTEITERPLEANMSRIGQDSYSKGGSEDDLSAQDRKTYAIALEIFNSRIISSIVSRDLQDRLYALEYVKEFMENENYQDDTDLACDKVLLSSATFQILNAALTDTREKVVSMSFALLDQVVKFSLQNEVPTSSTFQSLEPIFALLLIRASDLNTRVRQGTLDRIVMLCNCFRSHPYSVLPLVFKPARSTVLYRQAQARVEIVARLANEFGVYDGTAGIGTAGGLDFENITEFAIPYINHTNAEVRVAARKLIIDVCKFLSKTRVEQFLPGVKPLIIESIQKELERKRPTIASLRTPTPPAERTLNTSSRSQEARSPPSDTSRSSKGRGPIPFVDLHMDSLKRLLVEPPESPTTSKPSSRQSTRQRSDAALAHQARLKMPLRSSIKATQALYTGIPKSMAKKQSAMSPDEANESTASSETTKSLTSTPPSTAPRTAVRPLQPRTKAGQQRSLKKPGVPAVEKSSNQSDASPPSSSTKERFCVFCDERNSAFTDEGLVTHYWSECAMLANCQFCKIIIEVPTLTEHILHECTRRKFVKQCEMCREIMPADMFLPHVATGCQGVPESTVRCPLCQTIISPGDESSWKQHLMEDGGCPKNKKSLPSSTRRSQMTRSNTMQNSTSSSATTSAVTSPTSRSTGRSASVSRSHSSAFMANSSPVSPSGSALLDVPEYISQSRSTPTSSRATEGTGLYSPPAHHYTHTTGPDAGSPGSYPPRYLDQESVHPLDPVCPPIVVPNGLSSLSSSSSSASSSSIPHSATSHQIGRGTSSSISTPNTSRIPKLGAARSVSSNSLSGSTWK
ncbi:centrosomal protein CEP104 [Entomortierella parvispora]|uniref:Centrosomal protein CEP104 n=1 Tax=Entomortierella parvispora TaxID=205924 RepID=A0A9P3LS37_9FUNG|nr:centrosomal protein CEP104 [Entomortierella parvispora]